MHPCDHYLDLLNANWTGAMAELTPTEVVWRAAVVLNRSLQPVIPIVQSPSGLPWASYYVSRDRADGRPPRTYTLDDPLFVLTLFSNDWQSFRGTATSTHSVWAHEVRDVLDRASSEPGSIDADTARRAIRTMALLVAGVADDPATRDELERLASTIAASDTAPAPAPSEIQAALEAPQRPAPKEDRRDDGNGLRRVRLEVGSVVATAVHRSAVNYATANQQISPLVELRLENQSPQTQRIDSVTSHIEGVGQAETGLAVGPLELGPHETRSLSSSQLTWALDHQAFAELEEARTGRLTLNITVGDVSASGHGELRLLARDEWDASLTPELLAAFVTPNQPEITALLADASQLLEERTGSPSLVGYQEGADRAIDTARSIYDAIRTRDIRYSVPPASFESTGQKVRRPEDVLNERWGTCLDLSVLYASALEAAGISPVIALLRGHAFAGFLTEEVKLVELATSAPEQIQNLARSGLFVPVELTAATAGKETSFEAARRSTERYWDQDISHVRFLLDVAACRRRIRPLPRVRRDGASVVIEVQRPAAMALPTHHRSDEPAARLDTYPARVERWRAALLDLSFRNPLLKLRERADLRLHVPERCLGTFEDLLSRGQPLGLVAGLDLQQSVHQGQSDIRQVEHQNVAEILEREQRVHAVLTPERLGRSLDGLRRRAKSIVEETGSNNLFVTLGALRWKDASGKDALAPLYLLPVRLDGRTGSSYRITSEGDGAHLPNYCLIEKLRRDYELEIPELEIPPRDDSGIDVLAVLAAVRQAIARRGLPFAVESDVRLAILQFSTLEMWRDVSENWQQLMSNSVVRHLVDTPTETFVDAVATPVVSEITEAEEHLPVPTDGAQLEAIRWAREGRTFVLEGPPGTGKSQTITNMIANAVAHGRTVLFVAEKQAALDVVRRRLDSSGLGPLTLDLHGKDQTIKHVRAQLEQAWDYDAERDGGYESARRRLTGSVQALAGYADQLHRPGPAGLSLWEAHERVLRTDHTGHGDFVIPVRVVNGTEGLDDVYEAVRSVERSLSAIDGRIADQPWSLCGPRAQGLDYETVATAVQRLDAARAELPSQLVELITDASPAQLVTLVQAVRDLAAEPRLVSPRAESASWAQELHRLATDLDTYRQRFAPVLPYLTAAARSVDVALLRSQLIEAQSAGVMKRSRLVKAARARILALWGGPAIPDEQLHRFLDDIDQLQRDGRALYQRIAETLPTEGPPDVEGGGRLVHEVAGALDRWHSRDIGTSDSDRLNAYVTAARRGATAPGADFQTLNRFQECWIGLAGSVEASEKSIDTWRDDRSLVAAIDDSLPAWRDAMQHGHMGSLTRLQTAQHDLQRLRELGFDDLADQLADGRISSHALLELVETKIARAVQRQRLDETGLLAFRPDQRTTAIADLAASSRLAREHARTAIPQLVRDARGVDTRHPANDLAALRRQFQRKRGGSVRELMTDHGQALLKLTPCVLMSPPSVARYIPADAVTFDLVIFDEASQVRVADAIGALGRARSVVVVGDSQQMPPTSMFRSVTDVEDDAESDGVVVPIDQDSILKECVDSNLERLLLTWHYRSRDESLIAFSNAAYYHDQLATFPTPPHGQEDTGDGVHFRFVGGRYDGGSGGSRTNKVEADAIVAEVIRRLEEGPAASIGVVTLNTQQRELILDKLEILPGAVRRAFNRDVDPVFVKNLENVQGDERDTILFSLGFSPDPTSGVLRLNFGPVMTDGGERRLNVAITRARHEVVLFSSFQPEDIDLSRTSSVGLRHLREYLFFARDRDTLEVTDREPGGSTAGHPGEVAEALRATGLEVVENLGMSGFKVDLAVRLPDSTHWVAVLLDGPGWARRRTASDRDVLPTTVLTENMNWPAVERVWLPAWIRDREAVTRQLVDVARRVSAEPAEPEAVRIASTVELDVPEQLPLTDGRSPAEQTELPLAPLTPADDVTLVTFRSARSDDVWQSGALDRLDEYPVRQLVKDRIAEVVQIEGPVESHRLASIVAQSFGVGQVRRSREDALLALIPDAARRREGAHEFIWPDDLDPVTFRLVRVSEDSAERGVTVIPLVELSNAARHVLRARSVIRRDELRREMLTFFGFRREGGVIRERFDEAIDGLVAQDAARVDGALVRWLDA